MYGAADLSGYKVDLWQGLKRTSGGSQQVNLESCPNMVFKDYCRGNGEDSSRGGRSCGQHGLWFHSLASGTVKSKATRPKVFSRGSKY
jgi:hypothetical protein